MSPDPTRQDVLPKDLMEMQLGQADLLMAMYASDDASAAAAALDEASSQVAEVLRTWCEGDEPEAPEVRQKALSLLLSVQVPDGGGGGGEEASSFRGEKSLQLDITLPLVHDYGGADGGVDEPPRAKVRVRQPAWMSKAAVTGINGGIPEEEDLLTIIEHVKDEASRLLAEQQELAGEGDDDEKGEEDLVRVWFYFPSISSRGKRDDLVGGAPGSGLTGFLLAGKPGLLCLEGGSRAIDRYMSFVKAVSWGDIPPQHKKVSERYRESGPGVARAFEGMREITGEVGDRRGERANRNDMRALEAWLRERGLGEAFAKVLI
ncbi:hypothetical protein N3K66_007529 [Trichothecium roseum]|uniref:Uncharacterized protein n=1 Tax=Trichothecium roseum TaxID=47278 RepID=A0ACC0UUB7_9HYPO|nr:hypothetical protein N3K66_007529 [Trichothecium roseum]